VKQVRGRLYFVDTVDGDKPYLVVSSNARNRALDSTLAVRITTSRKPALPSVVELGPHDPLVGRALCDDIGEVFDVDVRRDAGAVTPDTMRRVERGLHAALGLVW
jgi:mRNA interferase MazF